MKENKEMVVWQTIRKVLAYMAKLSLERNQKELIKVPKFIVEDEIINFNSSLLRMEDLDATPTKMDDIRAEVQDSLEEINLGTA